MIDQWVSVLGIERPPSGKQVLIGPIDGEVVVGFWDGDRKMWFYDEGYANRPVSPKYWRLFPKLPNTRKKRDEINR